MTRDFSFAFMEIGVAYREDIDAVITVIVRARIKTKPLQQWGVCRAFNLQMQRRFDELGIELPFPHQTIYFGEDKSSIAPPGSVEVRDTREKPGRDGSEKKEGPAHTDNVDNFADDGE